METLVLLPVPKTTETGELLAAPPLRGVKVTRAGVVRPARPQTIWERARELQLVRYDPLGRAHTLEPGVNFFILALERLGARTSWSCEGHPHGFYIAFHGTYKLAQLVQGWGFFTVEVEGRFYWSLRFNAASEAAHPTDKELHRTMNWAADSWAKGMKKIGKPFVFPQ